MPLWGAKEPQTPIQAQPRSSKGPLAFFVLAAAIGALYWRYSKSSCALQEYALGPCGRADLIIALIAVVLLLAFVFIGKRPNAGETDVAMRKQGQK